MTLAKYECLWPGRKPDFARFQDVFQRIIPDRLLFIELFADPEIITAILDEKYIPYRKTNRQQCQAG